MFDWFKKKSIDEQIEAIKSVKVDGIKFKIKKINMIDYLNGSKVLLQVYDTYKLAKPADKIQSIDKIKSHYRDVLMAGVVSPKLSRKLEDEGFFVDKIFDNFALANKLYAEIIAHTYGKKKIKQLISQSLNSKK